MNCFAANGFSTSRVHFTQGPGIEGVQYLAKAKLRAELWTAEGQPHGFNRAPWSQVTVRKAYEFLAALGFLKGTPTVKLPDSAPELKSE